MENEKITNFSIKIINISFLRDIPSKTNTPINYAFNIVSFLPNTIFKFQFFKNLYKKNKENENRKI